MESFGTFFKTFWNFPEPFFGVYCIDQAAFIAAFATSNRIHMILTDFYGTLLRQKFGKDFKDISVYWLILLRQ